MPAGLAQARRPGPPRAQVCLHLQAQQPPGVRARQARESVSGCRSETGQQGTHRGLEPRPGVSSAWSPSPDSLDAPAPSRPAAQLSAGAGARGKLAAGSLPGVAATCFRRAAWQSTHPGPVGARPVQRSLTCGQASSCHGKGDRGMDFRPRRRGHSRVHRQQEGGQWAPAVRAGVSGTPRVSTHPTSFPFSWEHTVNNIKSPRQVRRHATEKEKGTHPSASNAVSRLTDKPPLPSAPGYSTMPPAFPCHATRTCSHRVPLFSHILNGSLLSGAALNTPGCST